MRLKYKFYGSSFFFWKRRKRNRRTVNLLKHSRKCDFQYIWKHFFYKAHRIYSSASYFFQHRIIPYFRYSDNYLVFRISVQNLIKIFLLFVLIFIMYFLIGWGLESIFFVSFVIISLFFNWDSRIAFVGAISCFVIIPILLILEKEALAERLAVDAYYFLVIGVVMEIASLSKSRFFNIYIKIRAAFKLLLKKYGIAPFVFLSLVSIITLPLFIKPGFIFFLDWVPKIQTPFPYDWRSPSFLFNLILWFLDLFLPGGFLQKMLLFITFFLVGFGMFRILRYQILKNRESWGAYFGGFFYIFNPFVYSRIITGQRSIIIAYALFPWLLSSLFSFINNSSFKNALRVAIWLTAISVIDIHLGALIILLLFFIGLYSLFNTWRKIFSLLKGYLLIAISFFVLNIYWLLPAIVTRTSRLSSFVSNTITNTDIFSFFTRPDPIHGVLWNTAAMYGFWADEENRFITMKLFVPYWFYLFLLILVLVLIGVGVSFWRGYKQYMYMRKRLNAFRDGENVQKFHGLSLSSTLALVSTGVCGFLFAVGVSYTPIKDEIMWLYEHIPFLKGLREPHKAVSLLVFVYAIFSAIAIDYILEIVHKIKRRSWRFVQVFIPGMLLVIPLAYSPGILWGFHGQIQPSNYPESWFAADRFLMEDKDDFRVLFLPWHMYINLSFANYNTIANPAQYFFHKPTIAGDNMEFGPIYSQSTRPESKYIEQEILGQRAFITNAGEKLAKINVKYVILVEESDYLNYFFIEKQNDLELVFQGDKIKVFLNKSWHR